MDIGSGGIVVKRTEHSLYEVWRNIKQRCNNPKKTGYKYYGGRGIKVCSKWENSFEEFVKDVGQRPKDHVLDRIDNNKGYEPGNCRWVSYKDIIKNKECSLIVEYGNETITLKDLAKLHNVSYQIALYRIKKKGWNIFKAATHPTDKEISNRVKNNKAKGRELQQRIVKDILITFPELTKHDVKSQVMGNAGIDIELSTKGQEILPLSIEAKNYKKIYYSTLTKGLEQAKKNQYQNTLPCVVTHESGENYKDKILVCNLKEFLVWYKREKEK